jgi:hypothetical protein
MPDRSIVDNFKLSGYKNRYAALLFAENADA